MSLKHIVRVKRSSDALGSTLIAEMHTIVSVIPVNITGIGHILTIKRQKSRKNGYFARKERKMSGYVMIILIMAIYIIVTNILGAAIISSEDKDASFGTASGFIAIVGLAITSMILFVISMIHWLITVLETL